MKKKKVIGNLLSIGAIIAGYTLVKNGTKEEFQEAEKLGDFATKEELENLPGKDKSLVGFGLILSGISGLVITNY
jgi:hypothetical protein